MRPQQPMVNKPPRSPIRNQSNTELSHKSLPKIRPMMTTYSDNSNIAVFSEKMEISAKSRHSSTKQLGDYSVSTQGLMAGPRALNERF